VFLFALFVVGSGLALLQVAINPYVGALGKPETAATRISICGFFNSFATNRAPKIGAALIFVAAGATTAELARSVRMPYVALGCFTLFLALVTAFVPLPAVLGNEPAAEAGAVKGHAWSFRHLRLGSFAIFAYVGAEVAIGSIMINFLGQPSMGGFSHVSAATYVSYYWGAAMAGRLLGSFLLPFVRTDRALAAVSVAAAGLICATIFTHGPIALWATVSCGLFNSVMWPCIFPLSLKGLGRFTSQGSGLLVMMVVGGAVIPEIQGLLADKFGYQHSFAIVLLCYAYIVYFALSGYRVHQPRFVSIPDYVPPAEI
jgi:FHS family L-fucose permease-like MFS transporter